MTYQTPALQDAARVRADIEIKKSIFYAFAFLVQSRKTVNTRLAELKAEFPDARHHCMGYLLGDPNNTTSAGFDDDGEPSGTAGKPILNVLQHKQIGDCAIIVVRYFGGIKLGAGGLTRAYAQSAQAVIDVLPLQNFVPMSTMTLSFDFAVEAQVRYFLGKFDGRIVEQNYTTKVCFCAELPTAHVDAFGQSLGGLAVELAVV